MGDLFLLSRADIFAIYPQILKELLEVDDAQRASEDATIQTEYLLLPSDSEYQERVYYRLLEIQRALNELIESGIMESCTGQSEKLLWDPLTNCCSNVSATTAPSPNRLAIRPKCFIDDPIKHLNKSDLNNWSLDDVVKAGKLL